jgi:hypothetical protein
MLEKEMSGSASNCSKAVGLRPSLGPVSHDSSLDSKSSSPPQVREWKNASRMRSGWPSSAERELERFLRFEQGFDLGSLLTSTKGPTSPPTPIPPHYPGFLSSLHHPLHRHVVRHPILEVHPPNCLRQSQSPCHHFFDESSSSTLPSDRPDVASCLTCVCMLYLVLRCCSVFHTVASASACPTDVERQGYRPRCRYRFGNRT